MPHAVLSLPSMANLIGPVVRVLVDLLSKLISSARTGCSTSEVAEAHFAFALFVGVLRSVASTRNSLNAQVPLKARPGPL